MYDEKMKMYDAVCNAECCEPAPIEPIRAIVDNISMKIESALENIYMINEALFGFGKPQEEKSQPKCYRDTICHQAEKMSKLIGELESLRKYFGI